MAFIQFIWDNPEDPEAEYCRMQIQNIVNAVVPKQELLDAQIEPVLAHIEHNGTLDAERTRATPLASGLPT